MIKNFFGTQDTTNQKKISPQTADESVHINQEMYKKSAELSEKNKTLSLLQRLNELLLGSIEDPKELAKQVTSLLITEVDFPLAIIFMYNKSTHTLMSLSGSQTIAFIDINKRIAISLDTQNNEITKAITDKNAIFTKNITNIFTISDTTSQIKSFFIAPLFVRNELLGVLTIAMREEEEALSEYRRDLLNRVVASLRIGMDNALLYRQVEDSNKRLKELDKLKNEFVSVASHELRTPMTAIKSYLWMALNDKGGALNEKQRYYVERGYNSVDRLIRLVNDMLNISRIESGRISIDMQPVDLIALTQEVVSEVLPRAQEGGITLTIQKPPLLPKVLADPDKIKEVLFNLIGNSLKFTPKGGTITVGYSAKDGFVETKIIDTGIGIAQEDIGKLFQKFGLLPGSYITNQTAMGTGLGLYICRSIIDLHHGEIKAESQGRGKGSTFTFTLREFNESELRAYKATSPDTQKDKIGLIHAEI